MYQCRPVTLRVGQRRGRGEGGERPGGYKVERMREKKMGEAHQRL
jgi:hypothetical protein